MFHTRGARCGVWIGAQMVEAIWLDREQPIIWAVTRVEEVVGHESLDVFYYNGYCYDTIYDANIQPLFSRKLGCRRHLSFAGVDVHVDQTTGVCLLRGIQGNDEACVVYKGPEWIGYFTLNNGTFGKILGIFTVGLDTGTEFHLVVRCTSAFVLYTVKGRQQDLLDAGETVPQRPGHVITLEDVQSAIARGCSALGCGYANEEKESVEYSQKAPAAYSGREMVDVQGVTVGRTVYFIIKGHLVGLSICLPNVKSCEPRDKVVAPVKPVSWPFWWQRGRSRAVAGDYRDLGTLSVLACLKNCCRSLGVSCGSVTWLSAKAWSVTDVSTGQRTKCDLLWMMSKNLEEARRVLLLRIVHDGQKLVFDKAATSPSLNTVSINDKHYAEGRREGLVMKVVGSSVLLDGTRPRLMIFWSNENSSQNQAQTVEIGMVYVSSILTPAVFLSPFLGEDIVWINDYPAATQLSVDSAVPLLSARENGSGALSAHDWGISEAQREPWLPLERFLTSIIDALGSGPSMLRRTPLESLKTSAHVSKRADYIELSENATPEPWIARCVSVVMFSRSAQLTRLCGGRRFSNGKQGHVQTHEAGDYFWTHRLGFDCAVILRLSSQRLHTGKPSSAVCVVPVRFQPTAILLPRAAIRCLLTEPENAKAEALKTCAGLHLVPFTAASQATGREEVAWSLGLIYGCLGDAAAGMWSTEYRKRAYQWVFTVIDELLALPDTFKVGNVEGVDDAAGVFKKSSDDTFVSRQRADTRFFLWVSSLQSSVLHRLIQRTLRYRYEFRKLRERLSKILVSAWDQSDASRETVDSLALFYLKLLCGLVETARIEELIVSSCPSLKQWGLRGCVEIPTRREACVEATTVDVLLLEKLRWCLLSAGRALRYSEGALGALSVLYERSQSVVQSQEQEVSALGLSSIQEVLVIAFGEAGQLPLHHLGSLGRQCRRCAYQWLMSLCFKQIGCSESCSAAENLSDTLLNRTETLAIKHLVRWDICRHHVGEGGSAKNPSEQSIGEERPGVKYWRGTILKPCPSSDIRMLLGDTLIRADSDSTKVKGIRAYVELYEGCAITKCAV